MVAHRTLVPKVGGSNPPTPAKLTSAQAKALASARDLGSVTAHLRGRSAFGGFVATQAVLVRNCWIRRVDGTITNAGLAALAAYEREKK